MSIRILHTADWHLGPFKGPADKDGMNLRYKRTIECLAEMIDVANKENPDIVCISGDIFHQEQVGPVRYSDEMLRAVAAINGLADASKLVIVMRGTPNHDGSGQFRVLEKIFEAHDKVVVVTEPRVISTPACDIAVLPGFDKQAFRAKFPGLSADEENQIWTEQIAVIVASLRAQCHGKNSVLMAHYTVPGCDMESGQTSCYANFEPVIPREALQAAGFDYVLLGHIHKPQKLEGLDNVYYSGAINALNFNDEGQLRGFWIHDTEGESQFYTTPCNRFRTLTWEKGSVEEYLRKGRMFMEEQGYRKSLNDHIVRLRYSCSDAQKKALNIPALQADLLEMGALYVANIETVQTVEVQNRGILNEEADPYENLKKWLEEKCVKDAGETAELAEPIIANALRQIAATEYQGEFKPVRIAVKNYRTYHESEFDYTDISFLSVNGVNGAGKSSLFFDAPMDCLFEKTREGDVKAWLRADPDARSGYIEFTFSIGDNTFRVTRTRQKSGKGTLNLSRLDGGEWVNMSYEKGADTQKEIEKVLGMDYMTFKTCALIMQDQYGLFLEARKEERIAILSNLLGLSIYNLMEKGAKDRLAEAKRECAAGKTAVQVKEQQIADKGDPDAELEILEDQIANTQTEIEAAKTELYNRNEMVETYSGLHDSMNELRKTSAQLNMDIVGLKSKADALRSRIEERKAVLDDADTIKAKAAEHDEAVKVMNDLAPDAARYTDLTGELEKKRSEIEELGAQIRRAETERDSAKSELEQLETEINDAADIDAKVEELYRLQIELAKEQDKCEQYVTAKSDWEKQKHRVLDEIQKREPRLIRLKSKLERAKQQETYMADSGCIDAVNATCKFLAQAKEDIASIPELQNNIKAWEEGTAGLNRELQDIDASFNEKLEGIGYDSSVLADLRNKVKEMLPYREKQAQITAHKLRVASLRSSIEEKDKTYQSMLETRRKGDIELEKLSKRVNKLAESVKKRDEAALKAKMRKSFKDVAESLPLMEVTQKSEEKDLEALTLDAAAKQAELNSVTDKMNEIKEDIAGQDIETLKRLASESASKLNELREHSDEMKRMQGAAQQRKEDIEAMRKEVAELKKGIEASADLAAKYEVLKVAFSQDGVPHQIIRNIIPYIRDKANGILGAMTGGTMGVEFQMEKTVKGRDGEKATLDILIEEYGKTTLPYTSKSGGEKVKASLAVNLSLAEVKMEASGIQIGFLGVDEPPFLDEDGTQAYVDSLEAIRKRNPRISIIAITHDPVMKARFSQSLTVTKTAEEGSRITYD